MEFPCGQLVNCKQVFGVQLPAKYPLWVIIETLIAQPNRACAKDIFLPDGSVTLEAVGGKRKAATCVHCR